MTILIVTLTAAFLGGLIGTLVGCAFLRRREEKDRQSRPVHPSPDPLTSASIDQVAAAWAAAHGQPAAKGLLADKLRLVFSLRQPPRRFNQKKGE